MSGECFFVDDFEISAAGQETGLDLATNVTRFARHHTDFDARSAIHEDVAARRNGPLGVFPTAKFDDLAAFVPNRTGYCRTHDA